MRAPSYRTRVLAAALFVVLFLVAAGVVLWLHGPNWSQLGSTFSSVRWGWVGVALALNLLSIIARAMAWKTVIDQAIEPPRPGYRAVVSAFSVGLFANAVLPGRIGEVARVAVLTRRAGKRKGIWATLLGTVFAHRVFDVFPVLALIAFVFATARMPQWAVTTVELVVIVGLALFVLALLVARQRGGSPLDGLGPVRRLIAMARQGLGVMHAPLAAAIAVAFQFAGWALQLLAVYTAMRAFHIHVPLPAAALVLLLLNVAILFPLWPGNVGLYQAAVAAPLLSYGVATARGVAFGVGLQAIEASVGIGIGMIFLAREGLSYAILKEMPEAGQVDLRSEPARHRIHVKRRSSAGDTDET
ncbi:MAG TPA: lysylphosphatidylglycerol synthase transmembrane domain-containing protein [Gaiellaceae bacterium]